jgi:predicted DNA-binding protein
VSPRRLQLQSLYLEPEKTELLDALAAETRIPKAVLLREAVDDLLIKYKKLKRAGGARKRG